MVPLRGALALDGRLLPVCLAGCELYLDGPSQSVLYICPACFSVERHRAAV